MVDAISPPLPVALIPDLDVYENNVYLLANENDKTQFYKTLCVHSLLGRGSYGAVLRTSIIQNMRKDSSSKAVSAPCPFHHKHTLEWKARRDPRRTRSCFACLPFLNAVAPSPGNVEMTTNAEEPSASLALKIFVGNDEKAKRNYQTELNVLIHMHEYMRNACQGQEKAICKFINFPVANGLLQSFGDDDKGSDLDHSARGSGCALIRGALLFPLFTCDVRDYIGRRSLSADNCKRLAMSMVDALTYIKRCHIVHGDIRAENVLMKRIGIAKQTVRTHTQSRSIYRFALSDFGFAEAVRPNNKVICTQSYWQCETCVAPEVYLIPDVVSFEVDAWGLGALLLDVLCTYTVRISHTLAYAYCNNDESTLALFMAHRKLIGLPNKGLLRHVDKYIYNMLDLGGLQYPEPGPKAGEENVFNAHHNGMLETMLESCVSNSKDYASTIIQTLCTMTKKLLHWDPGQRCTIPNARRMLNKCN